MTLIIDTEPPNQPHWLSDPDNFKSGQEVPLISPMKQAAKKNVNQALKDNRDIVTPQ